MTAANLAAAMVSALDDAAVAQLAERLRPHLDTDSRLLTAAQAADRLGLHPKTACAWHEKDASQPSRSATAGASDPTSSAFCLRLGHQPLRRRSSRRCADGVSGSRHPCGRSAANSPEGQRDVPLPLSARA
jgi:hypothetical protein